jgi:uncharacterized membrane protein YhdT
MSNNRRPYGAIAWIVAFLGFPVGGLAALSLIGALENPLEGLIGGAAAGAVLGLTQWLALRLRTPLTPLWIAASSIGLGVGVGLSVALFGADRSAQANALRAPLTGLIWGAAQWVFLQRSAAHAAWWIPTVALAYLIGWVVTAAVIGESLEQGFTVFGASGAVIFQIITGVALWRVIKFNVVQPPTA